MAFELSQQNWSSLANIYLQVLRSPTEKLHSYYENFEKFVTAMEEEMSQEKNHKMELEVVVPNDATLLSDNEISRVVEDLQCPDNEAVRSKAIRKYRMIGDQFYKRACELDGKIKHFEENIHRRYFDVTPLGDEQLKIWHRYLDFMEKQGDFSWALQLFERCLISCANYPEFWIRYVEFMETKGGRELANFALERAAKIFLKDSSEIRLFRSRFKERIGDTSAPQAAVMQRGTGSDFYLTRHVIELANMERRLGNTEAAYDIYDKDINMAEEKKQWDSLSTLFVHLSRLKYMITRSADEARDVLINGIQRVPNCRVLLEELIKFVMMHQGASQVDLIDSIVARAISPSTDGSQGLNCKDQEDISSLFLEFVDLCGTVDDIRKATYRHIRLFPEFLRPNFVSKNPYSDNLSNKISEKRQVSSSVLHQLQSANPESKINDIEEEQVHLPPVDKADSVSVGPYPEECEEKNEHRKRQISSDSVERSTDAASDLYELVEVIPGEAGSIQSLPEERREDEPRPKVAHDLVNELVKNIPGVVGSIHSLPEEPKQDEPGPMEMTPTSVQNSRRDAPASNSLACNLEDKPIPTGLEEPSGEQFNSVNMQDQEFKRCLNTVHLENISPKSPGKASQEITSVVSNEDDAILGASKSNRNSPELCLNSKTIPAMASPNHTPTTDSPQVQKCPDEVTSDVLLSPTSHRKHMPREVPMNSAVTLCTGGEFQKIKHIDTLPEVGNPKILSHSEDQKLSPKQCDATIAASEMLMAQGPLHPSVTKIAGPAEVHQETRAVHQNMSTDHVSPVNAVPDQSPFPTYQSSPLVSSPQPNLTPNTLQSSHQEASPNQNQTMNRAWQLYYHQHQQMVQQPQLQMVQQQQQHQQSYPQQQQYLPPQEQQNQQQVYSSQQQQYFQQQPQVPTAAYQVTQFQQQQAQQQSHQAQLQQGQQQQFLQQQLYQQAERLAYQMQQQGYEQQAAQAYAYQMVWQQYQFYQQGYGQTLPQEQQHQQLQHVYNQMWQQQQQPQVLQQQQQSDEQGQHYPNSSPSLDRLKGPSQNLQGQENAKEGSTSGRENTPESGSGQPWY